MANVFFKLRDSIWKKIWKERPKTIKIGGDKTTFLSSFWSAVKMPNCVSSSKFSLEKNCAKSSKSKYFCELNFHLLHLLLFWQYFVYMISLCTQLWFIYFQFMFQMHQKLNFLMYLSHEKVQTTLSDIDYAQNLHLASTNERKESLRYVNVCVCVWVRVKGREREISNGEQQTTSLKRRVPPLLVCFRQRRWWSHAASTLTRTRWKWERSFRLLPRHKPTALQEGGGFIVKKR